MHVLFKEGYADRAYMARYTDVPDELEAHLRAHDPDWAAGDHRPPRGRRSWTSPGSTARTKRSFIRVGYGFSRCRNGAAQHACGDLPAGGDRRLAASRRRRALCQRRALQLNKTLIEGLDASTRPCACSTSRASAPC